MTFEASAKLGGGAAGTRFDAIDPRARVVAAIGFAVTVVAMDSVASVALALVMAFAVAVAARLSARVLARRLLALEGFMAVLLATLPFSVPGDAVVALGPLEATREGLLLALLIALKANAVVVMVLAQVGTLEPVRLGHALNRLGVPQNFVVLLLITVRYIAVFQDEYRRLRQAMTARAFRLRSTWHSWRSIGWLMGMLLVRSHDRAARILQAMKCRGFAGRFPVMDDLRLRGPDVVYVLAIVAPVVALGLWGSL